jgi:hypothetical protein
MRFSIELRKLIIASNHPPLIALIREVLKQEYTKDYWGLSIDEDKLSYAKDATNPMEGRRISKKITAALTELHGLVKDIIPMTARELEVCGDKLKASIIKTQYKFIIVSPEEFAKYYHYSQYVENSNEDSTLHKSCMRGDEEQDYLEFYSYLPCKLLVMLNRNNKVVGRSILWQLAIKQGIQTGFKTVTHYDRIYYTTTVILALFEQHCMDNGFVCLDKDRTNYWFDISIPYTVKFPYVDSFRYGLIRPYSDRMFMTISTQPLNEGKLRSGDSLVQLDRTNGTLQYVKSECAACSGITSDIITINKRGYHSHCVVRWENTFIPRGCVIKDSNGNYTLIEILNKHVTNEEPIQF